ncbi:hypothetical protein BK138_17450 [Paenibacillus rhizosphaerae]|uniref:VOC domain-containing protein n=1 Tax=Paenibacillus rhizosphaerae TaxID=297318 RepID=A0A1R1EP93_9BACL|nr:VOC family protein [Paenibacillus rhizosphaerae]OMF53618.1 hypothetical protein BK138_17450 [Paenibacillus rhizosphaerae]
MPKQISSSLTVLSVSDVARSRAYYRDVLGFDVTDWWAQRDGLSGLALKLHQSPDPARIYPNPPEPGSELGIDVSAYVDTWAALDSLYEEFKSKGAVFAMEPTIFADGGPWKEFVVEDPDGYHLAFGGVDGSRAHCSIDPHIQSVFLCVRDLNRAVERYSQLLGLEVRKQDRYRHLHVFRLDNGSELMLDSNGMEDVPIAEKGPVLFKLSTYDIDQAAKEAQEIGFDIVYGIQRLPQVSFFNIRDEDGNTIMICQEHTGV